MKYITHHRYKGIDLCMKPINLPYGRELETVGEFIATADGRLVCAATSELAKQHFAKNDDGQGLLRGALTYAIAYGRRDGGNGFRFSDKEIQMLLLQWSRWLRQDVDTILFNEDFFSAGPEELKALADALHIKIRR